MLATSAWTPLRLIKIQAACFTKPVSQSCSLGCKTATFVLTKGASRTPQPTTDTNCMPFRICRNSLSKPGIEIQGKAWEYHKEAIIQLCDLLFNACSNFPLIKIQAACLTQSLSQNCSKIEKNCPQEVASQRIIAT